MSGLVFVAVWLAVSAAPALALNQCGGEDTKICRGEHGAGTQRCEAIPGDTGTDYVWGDCTLQDCDLGYKLSGGVCAPDYGGAAASCEIGYHLNNEGVCVPDTAPAPWPPPPPPPPPPLCIPGTAQACPIAHGQGIQICEGPGWGACAVTNCDSGYKQVANSCSAAAALSEEQQKRLEEEARKLAEANDGRQEKSLLDAKRLSELAGNRAATIGAIFCAEGANTALEDPALSASDLAACRDHFRTANGLNDAYGRKGFDADSGVAGEPGAQATLGKFGENFGVSGGEFLSRLLGARGDRSVLSVLTESKLSQDKLEKAFAAADEIGSGVTDPGKYAVSYGSSRKPAGTVRDKLKKALADAQKPQDGKKPPPAKVVGGDPKKNADLGRVEAFSAKDAFGDALRAEKELTIFDVVHARYLELAERQGLPHTR